MRTMGTKMGRTMGPLKERYKNFFKKDLKKEIKTFKLNNASINIIKYVAKEIRSRIN